MIPSLQRQMHAKRESCFGRGREVESHVLQGNRWVTGDFLQHKTYQFRAKLNSINSLALFHGRPLNQPGHCPNPQRTGLLMDESALT
jgi:hypothetical protein